MRPSTPLRCLPLMPAFFVLAPVTASPKPVQAFNTYETSPFLTSDNKGLVPELIKQLNGLLAGQYRLELRNLPRARLLQQHLRQPKDFDGVAMLINPRFVNDVEQQSYLWSKPLFDDYNVLVLQARQAPSELKEDWLQGKRLLAVRGQRLPGIDELVATGRLQREDFNSEMQTLQMVTAGRGDFAFMNHLMFQHLAREAGVSDQLVGVPVPGAAHFQRHILVGKGASDLLEPLNAAIDMLHCLPEWRKTAAEYGFATMPCRTSSELIPAPN